LAAALARHRRLAEELHAMIRRGERIGFAPIRFELDDLEAALVERGIPLRQLSEAARARPEAAAGIPPTDDGGRARSAEA
jgi:hypothetical protein